eukprot:jgi/Mesvir1/22781/Mv14171-RA.1
MALHAYTNKTLQGIQSILQFYGTVINIIEGFGYKQTRLACNAIDNTDFFWFAEIAHSWIAVVLRFQVKGGIEANRPGYTACVARARYNGLGWDNWLEDRVETERQKQVQATLRGEGSSPGAPLSPSTVRRLPKEERTELAGVPAMHRREQEDTWRTLPHFPETAATQYATTNETNVAVLEAEKRRFVVSEAKTLFGVTSAVGPGAQTMRTAPPEGFSACVPRNVSETGKRSLETTTQHFYKDPSQQASPGSPHFQDLRATGGTLSPHGKKSTFDRDFSKTDHPNRTTARPYPSKVKFDHQMP